MRINEIYNLINQTIFPQPIKNDNERLNEFLLQINNSSGSLANSIEQLKYSSQTNNNQQQNSDLTRSSLTQLQTHGAILAYITKKGEPPQNIDDINEFLHNQDINTDIPENYDDIIDLFFKAHLLENTNYYLHIDYKELINIAKQQYQKHSFDVILYNTININEKINILNNLIDKTFPCPTNVRDNANINEKFIENINQILPTLPENDKATLASIIIQKIYALKKLNLCTNLNAQIYLNNFYNRQIHTLLQHITKIDQIVNLIHALYINNRHQFRFINFSLGRNSVLSIIAELENEQIYNIINGIISSNMFNSYQLYELIAGNRQWIGTGLYQEILEIILRLAISNVTIFNEHPQFAINLLTEQNYFSLESYRELHTIIYNNRISQQRHQMPIFNKVALPKQCKNIFNTLMRKLTIPQQTILETIITKFCKLRELSNTMTQSITHILHSMNQNSLIADKCLSTAELYVESCGDGARMALIFMMLDIEIYSTNLSLERALTLARKKQQINSIVNYVIDKMHSQGDQVEVALWLLLKLQERNYISNIGVDNMLYPYCVTYKVLDKYGITLNDAIAIINTPNLKIEFESLSNIYPKLEEMFSKDFNRIRELHIEQTIIDKPNETSSEYLSRTKQIEDDLYIELLNHVCMYINETKNELEKK